MKKCLVLIAVVLFSVAIVIPVSAAPFSIMVGDNDGYGFGVVDNATNVYWPGAGPSGTDWDGRSLSEKTATNGAQITDVYSALFPNYGPNPSTSADVVFTLPGNVTSATLQIDMGDFQGLDDVLAYFNGVLQPDLLNFHDGFRNTVVRDFILDTDALTTANAAGEFILTIDRNLPSDFIAFDYFKLSGEASASVPEPSTLLLLGGGLIGLAGFRRKFKV